MVSQSRTRIRKHMIQNILQKIKKYIIIAILIALVAIPTWGMVKLGVLQFVNTDEIMAISFNKRLFDINE